MKRSSELARSDASSGQDLGTACVGEVKGRLAVKGFEDSERMPCWSAAL